ncbi:hypothetical protein [Mesorhizobium sp. B1-1-8]|uniref:hypothetical protein n=1 Tax=Mesorhizobium sp. B1-1-8 TaxID=2589976 RepID=UPI001D0162D6|nr:hypothetical protein [Mesorhizobium sp. B1-1-8]UCI08053.1 hypothetical protein FJ974_02960 [Mesorhizobium sp. B1-1-8]
MSRLFLPGIPACIDPFFSLPATRREPSTGARESHEAYLLGQSTPSRYADACRIFPDRAEFPRQGHQQKNRQNMPIGPNVTPSLLRASFVLSSRPPVEPGFATATKENVMRKIILAAAVLAALTGSASAFSVGSGNGNGNGNVGVGNGNGNGNANTGAFNGNFNGNGNFGIGNGNGNGNANAGAFNGNFNGNLNAGVANGNGNGNGNFGFGNGNVNGNGNFGLGNGNANGNGNWGAGNGNGNGNANQ